MLIVIEGVDGAGKTTVAQMLSKRLSIPYVKLFKDNQWVFKTFDGMNSYPEDLALMDLCRQTGMSIISDRGIVSAEVYSKEGKLHGDTWNRIWEELAPDSVFYIWLRRDLHDCYELRRSRWTYPQLVQLEVAFDYWYLALPSAIHKRTYYNGSDRRVEHVVDSIEADIRRVL